MPTIWQNVQAHFQGSHVKSLESGELRKLRPRAGRVTRVSSASVKPRDSRLHINAHASAVWRAAARMPEEIAVR